MGFEPTAHEACALPLRYDLHLFCPPDLGSATTTRRMMIGSPADLRVTETLLASISNESNTERSIFSGILRDSGGTRLKSQERFRWQSVFTRRKGKWRGNGQVVYTPSDVGTDGKGSWLEGSWNQTVCLSTSTSKWIKQLEPLIALPCFDTG